MNFNINPYDIEKSFYQVAFELMNKHALKVKDSYYRIVDCEFYFKHEEHNDLYVHGHKEQEKNGSWYFHGSGIDITTGDESTKACGGILIRGISKLSREMNANGNFIEVDKKTIGPLNVLTTIFAHFSNIFDRENAFFVINKDEITDFDLEVAELYKCTRVGLNADRDENDFHAKPYRYITFPYLPHKEKEKIISYLEKNDNSTNSIRSLFTLKYKKASQ